MKPKRRKRRIKWNRVTLALIILFIFIYGIVSLVQDVKSLFKQTEAKYSTKVVQDIVQTEKIVDSGVKLSPTVENVIEEPVVDEKVQSRQYRLTSYYTDDSMKSGTCTGSGKCIKDFQVNDKGWYTYKGKLVVAAATNECLHTKSGACGNWNEPKEGRKYFNYFDEIQVEIDGDTYDAIVLDSCGASMFVAEDRIDLFVSNSSSVIDRGYKGINMITVFAEYN